MRIASNPTYITVYKNAPFSRSNIVLFADNLFIVFKVAVKVDQLAVVEHPQLIAHGINHVLIVRNHKQLGKKVKKSVCSLQYKG